MLTALEDQLPHGKHDLHLDSIESTFIPADHDPALGLYNTSPIDQTFWC